MKERVYRFRRVERTLVGSRPHASVLDLGCGAGDNLRRLARYGAQPLGVDPSLARLRGARALAPVAAAWGERLPWKGESFDLVYLSHVLHHARDLEAVLRECQRVLRPGGVLFLIETVDDSPLMRLARRIQPRWEGDAVLNRFRFRELADRVRAHGFDIAAGAPFNWIYFAWELLPLRLPVLDRVSPLFIGLEALGSPLLDRFGGHAWLVAEKPGPPIFPRIPGSGSSAPS